MAATLTNDYGAYEVTDTFLKNCQFYVDMIGDLEDIDESDISTVPISNFDDNKELHDFVEKIKKEQQIELKLDYKELVEDYIKLFNTLYDLKVTHNGAEMSWMEWYNKENETYVEDILKKNADPPHCDELAKIYCEYTPEKLEMLLILDEFFHNDLMYSSICGLSVAMVHVGDREDASEFQKKYADETVEEIMRITKEDMDREYEEEQAKNKAAEEAVAKAAAGPDCSREAIEILKAITAVSAAAPEA